MKCTVVSSNMAESAVHQQPTCKERVTSHLRSRISDLRKLWKAEREGKEEGVEDLGTFNEYGLCFDYVAPGTFKGQRRGYFRYQLSYGGPSDEFRFYTGAEMELDRIEYWFLDWFDGAHRVLKGRDLELLTEIFSFFKDCGSCEAELRKAGE